MIKFFTASLTSSLVECAILCLVGGATVTSVWYILIGLGIEQKSGSFYLLLAGVTIPLIWFSLFWIKVLLIPGSRGKLSVFSPIPTTSCQIVFTNKEDIVPIIAGTWLTIWLFVVTIGWCMAIRHEPIRYKTGHRMLNFPNACAASNERFQKWFKKEYIPKVKDLQPASLFKRKFIVFQPSPSLTFEQKINGLFTAFALSIVTEREFLVDWSDDMDEVLSNPGWNWNFKNVYKKRITPAIIDLVTPPSYIVPPSHKWRWSDILQYNLSDVMIGDNPVTVVDCDEFLAPLLWLNPVYKEFLCGLCNIENIYYNFAKVLLNWSERVQNLASDAVSDMKSNIVMMVADSTLTSRRRLRKMTDTMMRCGDAVDAKAPSWLVMRKGSRLNDFPGWAVIGDHKVFYTDTIKTTGAIDEIVMQNAVMYRIAQSSKAVIGFTGSALAESLAFSADIPLYFVLHRTPFCGEVAVRLPCIEKWVNILNSPKINISSFMAAEMTNMGKCRV